MNILALWLLIIILVGVLALILARAQEDCICHQVMKDTNRKLDGIRQSIDTLIMKYHVPPSAVFIEKKDSVTKKAKQKESHDLP